MNNKYDVEKVFINLDPFTEYESPIKMFESEMRMNYENGVMKAVQNVGFDVNKEELQKTLEYDRNQYEEGYNDAIRDLRHVIGTIQDTVNDLNYIVMRIKEQICKK